MKNNMHRVYRSPVYPDGIEVLADSEGRIYSHFLGESRLLRLPENYTWELAIAAAIYSVSAEQLKLIAPRKNDSLLIVSDGGPEGLITLVAAQLFEHLSLFYMSPDQSLRNLVERFGARPYLSAAEMSEKIRHETGEEGPNLVIDLSAEEGLVSLVANQIISQAGRMVIGRRDEIENSYQMRMGSYKELNIFGLDRCSEIAACSSATLNVLEGIADIFFPYSS